MRSEFSFLPSVPGASGSFLEQEETLVSLVSRMPFRDRPMALSSLDLGQHSDAEKNLLTSLAAGIYSPFEVHYHHVGGMPDAGVCGGREWYQRSPSGW
jgi:hypothetical protein